MKKIILTAVIALFSALSVWGADLNYDFTAISGTNTLYYRVTDEVNKHVAVVNELGSYPYYTIDEVDYSDMHMKLLPQQRAAIGVEGTQPKGELLIPTTVVNDNVTYLVTGIDDYAFYCCDALTGSVNIPENIISIGESAFSDCSELSNIIMYSMTPPSDVRNGAFKNIKEGATVTIPHGAKNNYGDGITWQGLTVVEALPVGDSWQVACGEGFVKYTTTAVGEVSIEIGDADPTGELIIPARVADNNGAIYSVTSIKDYAFFGCDDLTGNLTISEGVKSIGDNAFYCCDGLTGSLTIPTSVTSIGESAFAYCSGLTGSLTIPTSVTSIGEMAFTYCSGFTGDLIISEGVANIGVEAFYYCSGFAGNISIPSSVTSIEAKAFANCSSIAGFVVSERNAVYSSNDGILYNKDKTELIKCPVSKSGSLIIPISVTNISNNAFYYCLNLTEVVIPANISTIGNKAFRSCDALEVVLIPASITSIGSNAFENSCKLANVIMLGNNPPATIGSNVFDSVAEGATVTVPKGAKNNYGDGITWLGLTIVEDISTSVNDVAQIAPFTQVCNKLYFNESTKIAIYTISGKMLYKGKALEYTLPNAGVYIVCTNSESYKVMGK